MTNLGSFDFESFGEPINIQFEDTWFDPSEACHDSTQSLSEEQPDSFRNDSFGIEYIPM